MFEEQDGVATRAQLLAAGVTIGRLRRCLDDGRWQALHRGVYATFSGPVPPRAQVWAAVLRGGAGAVAGPMTTLWLVGVVDRLERIDVLVPADRRMTGESGVDILRCRSAGERSHPAARPPRLHVEDAVLLACERATKPEQVVDLVVRAVQRRRTTPGRLRARLGPRMRWRRLFDDLVADVQDGVRSPLERRWLHGVHRAHGLPPVVLDRLDDSGPRRAYRDAEFVEFGLVVELDGRDAHPPEEAHRDRDRDNEVTISGRVTLRFGWREVAGNPCAVAGKVARALQALGWDGAPVRCGPGCLLP